MKGGMDRQERGCCGRERKEMEGDSKGEREGEKQIEDEIAYLGIVKKFSLLPCRIS